MVQDTVRVYGALQGQPGVSVIERSGTNVLSDPRYGSIMLMGILKRGPMGVMVPLSSLSEYHSFYGDPRDTTWHLYRDGSNLTPDAIDGFYAVGGGKGQLWAMRVELDDAKRSSITLKNSLGADALKISAANEGRWGGRGRKIAAKPLIYATNRTFTIHQPGVKTNEFVDSVATFADGDGREYIVVANTKSDPQSGEVVFTLGSQYSLIAAGVSGPTALLGTVSYENTVALDGVGSFSATRNISGTSNISGRVVTGVGTQYATDFKIGSNIYVDGEARTIDSITSQTTATISQPFSFGDRANVTIGVDNLVVTGVGSNYLDPLEGVAPGDMLYAVVSGERQARQIASVDDNATITLVTGFTESFVSTQLEKDNKLLQGNSTNFLSQVQVGDYLVDPNRSSNAVKVVQILANDLILLESPFSRDFTDAQITKQARTVEIELRQNGQEGLAVQVGQGTKFPATHFSIEVYFNGSRVWGVGDASLDPNDRYFIESLVNEDGENIVYRSGADNYQRWITAEAVWESTYTTSENADVRPLNGGGRILALEPRKLYTIGQVDYSRVVGNLLYPNPYETPRNYLRVVGARAPQVIQGSVTTLGNTMSGVATVFRDELAIGDYVHDEVSGETRRVVAVISASQAVLDDAFTEDLLNAKVWRAGWLECSAGYDLTQQTAVNRRFSVSYPEFLRGGHDGNESGVTTYNWTRYVDLDTNPIENAIWGKDLGLLRFATPGVADITIQKACAAYAQARAFEYRAEIPSNIRTSATAERFLNQQLGRSDFETLAFPSYGYIASPFGAGDRLVPINGDIMGGESARAVDAQGYHRVFAGTEAVMSRIIKLPFDLKPQDESILNLAGIQPVKFMYGNCVVFGARNPALSSLYDFTHIRRVQSNYVRVFLENRNLLNQLFKPNQPELLDEVIMILDNWARREYKKGVFSRYLDFRQAVELRSTNVGSGVINDSETAQGLVEIINGKLSIYISYVPTGIVEVLALNIGPDIVSANYGASLANSL
jgi:hypothetical protein